MNPLVPLRNKALPQWKLSLLFSGRFPGPKLDFSRFRV